MLSNSSEVSWRRDTVEGPFFLVDVFTDRPLQGNPVAVVPEAERLHKSQMQAIAREFNQAETTFLLPSIRPEAHRMIGGAPLGAEASVDMNQLLNGRTVRGIIQGDAVPRLFIPKLIDLYRSGRCPFDRLIRFYDFAEINEAIEDIKKGQTIKAVLKVSTPDG